MGPVELLFSDDKERDNPTDGYRAVALKEGIEGDLVNLVRSWQNRLRREDTEYAPLEDYDPTVDLEFGDEAQFLQVDAESELGRLVGAIPASSEAIGWTRDEGGFGPVSWLILRVGFGDGRNAVFVRRLAARKRLQEESRFVGYFIGERFASLRESDAISVDDQFDFVLFGNMAFILRPPQFERFFGFLDLLKDHVSAKLDTLAPYFQEADLVALKTGSLASPRDLRKLRGELLDLGRVNTRVLRQFVSKYHLPITVISNGHGFKLGFRPEHRSHVVHLLTDSFLASELSDQIYVATSKRRIAN